MEIPNNSPIGGDLDGMGSFDNAPMPPMGADDNMGMGDPMGGDPNAMGDDPMGNDPSAMGSEEPPMGASADDDELMNIVNGMSTEDKAAVIKYAKSMADDSDEEVPQGGEMPMESRVSYSAIIDETINDMLNDRSGTKRPSKKIPKEYKGMTSPFKSPY